jgi:hypothetical protein
MALLNTTRRIFIRQARGLQKQAECNTFSVEEACKARIALHVLSGFFMQKNKSNHSLLLFASSKYHIFNRLLFFSKRQRHWPETVPILPTLSVPFLLSLGGVLWIE